MLRFYGYKKCSSCREAEKILTEKKIPYEYIDITTYPPSVAELTAWVKASGIDIKKYLNTSGEVYRTMGLKDRIDQLSNAQIVELLASNGRLIKRPLITDGQRTIPLAEFRA